MKWLTTFLCLLAITPAFAEEENFKPPVVQLPMIVTCSPIPPEIVLKQYDEIPFVEGTGYIAIPGDREMVGKFRMFLNPDGKTFTIMLTLPGEIHCMIMSGADVTPAGLGDPI